MVSLLIIILLSYIAGSFPSGIVLGRILKGVDVREHGSKNMGATNVFRVLGAKIAIPVLLLDMIKGAIPVLIFAHINFGDLALDIYWLKIIAGLAATLGHVFSLWVRFKGGKGVATAAGVYFGMMPLEVGLAIFLFIIVVAITRYVSLGSILGVLFIFCAQILQITYLGIVIPKPYIIMTILLVLMIVITHRQNIKRLLKGEENKFGQKRK